MAESTKQSIDPEVLKEAAELARCKVEEFESLPLLSRAISIQFAHENIHRRRLVSEITMMRIALGKIANHEVDLNGAVALARETLSRGPQS